MSEQKQKEKKPGYQIHKIYEGANAKNKNCPKCGPGTFMADHSDRSTCGKCNYMEKK